MSRRRGRYVTVIAACTMALCLLPLLPAAAAAEAGPAWRVIQATAPTNLVPGTEDGNILALYAVPRWMIFMTNVGGGTAGAATFTDTLPAGVTVSAAAQPSIEVSVGEASSFTKSCTVSGQMVTCEMTKSLPPGGLAEINVPLAVSPSASGEVVNQVSVFGGGAAAVSSSVAATISPAPAAFGYLPGTGLRASAFDDGGLTPTAGSHPYDVEIGAEFSTVELPSPGGAPSAVVPSQGLRNVRFDLPGGLVVNPSAVPVRCTTPELEFSQCPVESQVGVVEAELTLANRAPYELYSMVPPPGHPAEFAFNYKPGGVIIHILGGLNGDFHLTAESTELLTHFALLGVDTFLWGVPSDPGHDTFRRGLGCEKGCSVQASPAPFLTMPSSCTEPLAIDGTVESWQGGSGMMTPPMVDADGEPIQITGCNSLAFEPTIKSKATTNASDSPTGLDFAIHQPQDESLTGRATSTLKNVTVTLPDGMTLNPAAANGLASCTESQMGYAPEGAKVRFDTEPQTCPDAAKVGTVTATTPLLDETLTGAVYVAKPFQNPFDSLLAIYLAIESRKSGIVAKLAGKVEPNPVTGQLTATFTENPELPLNDIEVEFFKGANAALKSPLSCGTKTTTTTLTPWSTPEGVDVHPTDSFETSVPASGSGVCPTSEADAPKDFSLSAGTVSPLAGAYSPFVLRLARRDGTQQITGVDTTLPEGLLGRLAGVPYCPQAGIAQAVSREVPERGKEEQASPSCPAASEVGTVQVTAGAGISPVPVSGHAYLAGSYKGAPLSLVVIVPAVTGPFDLGTVVDRVALNVDEYSARIHAVADPLPTIRDGIPLDVRTIELNLDRPSFTLNPTSCEAMAVEGSASTQAGQSTPLKNPFQVGECGRLGFKPKIAISLKGPTKRAGLPALRATVTYPKGGAYANIARAQVSLPHSEFLEQGNLDQTCTKPLLAAHACPASSIYGKVKAWTPLLEKPLEGNVYLVGGYGYKLPAMVAELNGQLRVLLVGKVDISKSGGIRNTFEAVPDAPVEKFVLELKGGKKYGLLVNSEDICKKKQVAGAVFTAQNGKTLSLSPTVANSCKGKGKKKHKKSKSHR
jgi:hypothetical protein